MVDEDFSRSVYRVNPFCTEQHFPPSCNSCRFKAYITAQKCVGIPELSKNVYTLKSSRHK